MACPLITLVTILMSTLRVLGQMTTSGDQGYFKWTISRFDSNMADVMTVTEGDTDVFSFNFSVINVSVQNMTSATNKRLFLSSSNPEVMTVDSSKLYNITNDTSTIVNAAMRGVFLGRAFLKFHVNTDLFEEVTKSVQIWKKNDNSYYWYDLPTEYEVVVKRRKSVLNTIFTVTVIVIVCLANVAMGCKIDLQVVKDTLKKPIAPITGLASQFILMPLISFFVGIALDISPPLAFGFFAMGCSPGGSASNIYTYFLDGNVSLSVTMTFISTIASIAMIPLWLFTLGIKVIYKTSTLTIPFANIVLSLLGLLIPVAIGILIQKKRPKWAKFMIIALKPITVIFVIVLFTLGVYANLYIFRFFTIPILISGALVPYCGFIFGGIVAFVTRRKSSDILTIAIETGIQNTGVAIVMLQLSLPPPDSDISIVAPITGAVFTPIPLLFAMIINLVRKRMHEKRRRAETPINDELDKTKLQGVTEEPILLGHKVVTYDNGRTSEDEEATFLKEHKAIHG